MKWCQRHMSRRHQFNMREATALALKARRVVRQDSAKNLELCLESSRNLVGIINWIRENGHSKIFLRNFGHSASCKRVNCSPYCNLFRRLRRHVNAHRPCHLLKIYGILLRSHVRQCNIPTCGIEICQWIQMQRIAPRETVRRVAIKG